MHLNNRLTTALALFITLCTALASSVCNAQDDDLRKLEGTWIFVEDRTEGRPVDKGGAPMSMKFSLHVKKDAVIYPRRRGDERITLDNSVIEKEGGKDKERNDYVKRYRGKWTKKDGWLEYWLETARKKDDEIVYVLKRVFRPTEVAQYW